MSLFLKFIGTLFVILTHTHTKSVSFFSDLEKSIVKIHMETRGHPKTKVIKQLKKQKVGVNGNTSLSDVQQGCGDQNSLVPLF